MMVTACSHTSKEHHHFKDQRLFLSFLDSRKHWWVMCFLFFYWESQERKPKRVLKSKKCRNASSLNEIKLLIKNYREFIDVMKRRLIRGLDSRREIGFVNKVSALGTCAFEAYAPQAVKQFVDEISEAANKPFKSSGDDFGEQNWRKEIMSCCDECFSKNADYKKFWCYCSKFPQNLFESVRYSPVYL